MAATGRGVDATVGERPGRRCTGSPTAWPPAAAVVVSHGAALRSARLGCWGCQRMVGHMGRSRLLLVSSGPAQLPVAAHRAQRRHVAGAGAQRRPLTVAAGVGRGAMAWRSAWLAGWARQVVAGVIRRGRAGRGGWWDLRWAEEAACSKVVLRTGTLLWSMPLGMGAVPGL